MIAHPLRRSRATSGRINLLHAAFFLLFCFSNPSHFSHLHTFNTNHLSSPYFFLTVKEHVPAAPAPSPHGGAAVPVWERRCLLSAVWLGKVRLHSLQM